MSLLQKKKLRELISLEKKKYSIEEKKDLSKPIWESIEQLNSFQESKIVLLYYSLPDEVYTHQFIKKWSGQKQILLPVVKGNSLVLRMYQKGCFTSGVFDILEPTGADFLEWDKIDFTIVPALAYDRKGNRLGRGGGYYDRILPQITGVKVGVCFPFQIIDEIPTEDFDYSVDLVIFD